VKGPKSIYGRFIAFEEQAAEIYLRLASRFCPENPDLSAVWLDMGMQEKQHAGLLQFCLAEGLFAADLPTEAEIRKVQGLFASLKKRALNPALKIKDAFQIALEMETSEINTIYSHLTTPVHGSMYLLRRKISTSMPDRRAAYWSKDESSERRPVCSRNWKVSFRSRNRTQTFSSSASSLRDPLFPSSTPEPDAPDLHGGL
jgi:rubrerythrin